LDSAVRQAVAAGPATLQDDVDDQRHDDQYGNLHAWALQNGAWTTIRIATAALAVISISSIHDESLYINLE
jgi:hypothetical protein